MHARTTRRADRFSERQQPECCPFGTCRLVVRPAPDLRLERWKRSAPRQTMRRSENRKGIDPGQGTPINQIDLEKAVTTKRNSRFTECFYPLSLVFMRISVQSSAVQRLPSNVQVSGLKIKWNDGAFACFFKASGPFGSQFRRRNARVTAWLGRTSLLSYF